MRKIFFLRNFISLIIIIIFVFSSPSFAIASNAKALLAGGCFWCLEHDLEDLEGVVSVKSGYSGGDLDNPTYQNHQGHQEVVLVNYDSNEISYQQLLRSYWRNIDPFDRNGQFCDKGNSYKPVIFFMNEDQFIDASLSIKNAAEELLVPVKKIGVKIKPSKSFWLAERYHQDYAKNNNLKYNIYRYTCGRDKRLKEVWGENSQSGADWGGLRTLEKP